MDILRAIVEWISRRKLLSAFLIAVSVAATIGGRTFIRLNSGLVSDPLKRGKIIDAVYGIGTVAANRRHSFNPLVGNTIDRTFVKEGDFVKKGEPMVRTSDGTIVRASFDGVVNFFPYRNGENTYAATPMIVLTDMSDRYIVVTMEQQGALRVKAGQTAKISFDSLRHATFEGKVSAVYAYQSNFLARIDAVDLPKSILPEMTCDVAIVIDEKSGALLIPVAAFDDGKIWLKREGTLPRAVPVKLGVNDGTWAEVVESELREGDRLLLRKQAGQ